MPTSSEFSPTSLEFSRDAKAEAIATNWFRGRKNFSGTSCRVTVKVRFLLLFLLHDVLTYACMSGLWLFIAVVTPKFISTATFRAEHLNFVILPLFQVQYNAI